MMMRGMIQIHKNDLREFVVYKDPAYEIVLYQMDLKKIYRALKNNHNDSLAKKIRLMIFLKDYRENTKSDIDSDVFRGDTSKLILSQNDYRVYLDNINQLSAKMERFYHG
jgi:hypothetical protein